MDNKRIPNLEIEDARLIFKNFAGEPDQYTRKGERNVSIVLDEEDAKRLREDGWNVKSRPMKDEDGEYYFIKVKIRYDGGFPPNIWLCTKRNKTLLNEETVGMLDRAEIVKADVIVSAYPYEVNGKTGISAYVKTMYVTIAEDRFAANYDYE